MQSTRDSNVGWQCGVVRSYMPPFHVTVSTGPIVSHVPTSTTGSPRGSLFGPLGLEHGCILHAAMPIRQLRRIVEMKMPQPAFKGEAFDGTVPAFDCLGRSIAFSAIKQNLSSSTIHNRRVFFLFCVLPLSVVHRADRSDYGQPRGFMHGKRRLLLCSYPGGTGPVHGVVESGPTNVSCCSSVRSTSVQSR